jgi:predicted DNA-binding ribbon-helix-helix protein
VSAHLRKRSVTIAGHATSIALEPDFWAVFDAECARRGVSAAALIAEIDAARTGPLASAIRVHLLRAVSSRAGRPADP